MCRAVGSEHSDDLAGRHRQAGGAELPALVIIGMMGRLSPLWRSAMAVLSADGAQEDELSLIHI